MSIRMSRVCTGWLLLAGYAATAIAQQSRTVTFAEKVAPVVKKQLEINYPHDRETQERLWNSWKTANGLKELAAEEGARILEQKKSAPPQTRAELERQLVQKIDQLDKLDKEEQGLIREADALLMDLISPNRPNPAAELQLPQDDGDMASVFTNSGLHRVRVEFTRSDALRYLERWDEALGATPQQHSPEEVLEVLGQIDGASAYPVADVAPAGTDFFQVLGQLRSVESQIRDHNDRKTRIGPDESEAYNAEADSLDEQMRELLASIDEDTARVFFARPSEPEVNAAADRLRQLLNKRSNSSNKDGQICPDPPPPVQPPKLLN